MPPVDAHQVLMTGENSFIRLSHDGGETMSDRTSPRRVPWCPAGAGHALFMQGELTSSADAGTPAGCEQVIEATRAGLGPVEILVDNAGSSA